MIRRLIGVLDFDVSSHVVINWHMPEQLAGKAVQ